MTDEPVGSGNASLEEQTRAVFDLQHREQAADPGTFERLVSLTSPDYFQVPEDFFHDKVVLDAGCGSNANASYAFLQAGVQHVHAADIGNNWMDFARQKLSEFSGRFTLNSEDVLRLSFDSETFDFVHCAGVLHSVRDPGAGFAELARVTAPGGYTFVTVMGTGNGIIYPWINLLRDKYNTDPGFRAGVDGLDAAALQHAVEWILTTKDEFEPSSEEEKAFVRGFVDADLVVTIKDRIQAPTYHEFSIMEDDVRQWYENEGYTDVTRLTRYPQGIGNFRRFLAPLFYHYDHPLARLLFGDGHVQIIGRKPLP